MSWHPDGSRYVSTFILGCRVNGKPYTVYAYIDRNQNSIMDNNETYTCGNQLSNCIEVYPPQNIELVFRDQ